MATAGISRSTVIIIRRLRYVAIAFTRLRCCLLLIALARTYGILFFWFLILSVMFLGITVTEIYLVLAIRTSKITEIHYNTISCTPSSKRKNVIVGWILPHRGLNYDADGILIVLRYTYLRYKRVTLWNDRSFYLWA